MEYLLNHLDELSGHPFMQGLLACVATFIMEDPTVLTCGLLIADEKMGFWTAVIGLSIGITIGDIGLYVIGRFAGPWVEKKKWVEPETFDKVRDALHKNLFTAIVASRFLPGTRIPMFVGAGFFKASVIRFLLVACLASLLWTMFLLTITIKVGQAIFPLLGEMKWYVLLAIAVGFLIWRVVRRRRLARLAEAQHRVVSSFEFWPPWLFYMPVVVYYTLLAIRYRSITLPSLANPNIYSGGICRESKSQILELVPEGLRKELVAKTVIWNPPPDGSASELARLAELATATEGIHFPMVAKPDEGQRGAGVRRLADSHELTAYLETYPRSVPLIFQELVDWPGEAGILYYRYPGADRGYILSITLKELPCVVGDGVHTLRQLILKDRRASLIPGVYFKRHADRLDYVIPKGEKFQLVFAGNHCQGAIFRDGTPRATPQLLAAMQRLIHAMPEFYFGRLDVKYKDDEALFQRGEFRIMEINGASAESTHIWDASIGLRQAYSILFRQFRILFRIGAMNRRRGLQTIGAKAIIKDFIQYLRQSKFYPPTS